MVQNEFKFEEGSSYDFVVTGEIVMPPDDEVFFVLCSAMNSRHLLSKKLFGHYGIAPGMKLRCKVDKINCSGKMFLEPEHPHYKTGEVYEFSVTGCKEIVNSAGLTEQLLMVTDVAGNNISLPLPAQFVDALPERIACRVIRIKKGLLLISPDTGQDELSRLEQGKQYLFKLNGITTLAEGLEYYKLEWEHEIHYLRTRYYPAYDFPGRGEVNCRVVDVVMPYAHYLEPEHPYYNEDGIYGFECEGRRNVSNDLFESYDVLQLKDRMGHSYPVTCKNTDSAPGSMVQCRVRKIRMSKLYLECLE